MKKILKSLFQNSINNPEHKAYAAKILKLLIFNMLGFFILSVLFTLFVFNNKAGAITVIALIILIALISAGQVILAIKKYHKTANKFKDEIDRSSKMEKELAHSDIVYNELVESIQDVIFKCDKDWKITYINRACEKIYGFSAGEMKGTIFFDFAGKNTSEKDTDLCNKLLLIGGSITGYETIHFKKNAIPVYLSLNADYMHDSSGKTIGIQGTVRDISIQKTFSRRQEFTIYILQLLNKNEDMEILIKNMLLQIREYTGADAVGFRIQKDNDFPYFDNEGLSEIFVEKEKNLCAFDINNNPVRDEAGNITLDCLCGMIIKGKTDDKHIFFTRNGSFLTDSTTGFAEKIKNKAQFKNLRNQCMKYGYESLALIPLKTSKEIIGLIQLCGKNPNMFDRELIIFLEGIANAAGIAVNRKMIEIQLKESLNEKTALIQELYHRTKNNMMVISSFLQLQKDFINDIKLNGIIDDTVLRIQSMALVHQKLYQSKKLSKINLKEYIIELLSMINKLYAKPDKKIMVIDQIEDIETIIDIAIPCGMVINEIAVNSYKHAFPNRDGEIRIKASLNQDKSLNLEMSDNGIGLPESFDLKKSKTLGHLIIFNLIEKQLKGQIEYGRINGLNYKITVRTDIYKERIS